MALNTLPFQYLLRAAALEEVDGATRAAGLEQRDQELEDYLGRIGTGTGGGGEPGPVGPPGPAGAPGVVQGIVAGANVTVNSANPAYPIVSSTGGGGTGTDEVWIGTEPPADPNIELWFDTDATAPVISATQIVAIPYASWPPVDPLPNVLYLRLAP